MILFKDIQATPYNKNKGPVQKTSLTKEEKTLKYAAQRERDKLRKATAKKNRSQEDFALGALARSARGGAFGLDNKRGTRLCSLGLTAFSGADHDDENDD